MLSETYNNTISFSVGKMSTFSDQKQLLFKDHSAAIAADAKCYNLLEHAETFSSSDPLKRKSRALVKNVEIPF